MLKRIGVIVLVAIGGSASCLELGEQLSITQACMGSFLVPKPELAICR